MISDPRKTFGLLLASPFFVLGILLGWVGLGCIYFAEGLYGESVFLKDANRIADGERDHE